MVAQALLSLNFVAVGNGHVVHLVAETQDEHILSVSPGRCHTLPHGNMFLSLRISPMAHHHLTAQTHTRAYMAELPVAVRALIEIHKIHVDIVPWNLGIILGVEMEQRLAQLLETMNPTSWQGRTCASR